MLTLDTKHDVAKHTRPTHTQTQYTHTPNTHTHTVTVSVCQVSRNYSVPLVYTHTPFIVL